MTSTIDPATLKRHAIDLFNECWSLIDKQARGEQDTREMIGAAQASHWFWTQVPDHTATHESVGLWQLSRVYALAGSGNLASLYARRCLEVSAGPDIDGFYRAYAGEALARGLLLEGKRNEAQTALAQARLDLATSAETETATLVADLAELEAASLQ
jgi:hypothetical protein